MRTPLAPQQYCAIGWGEQWRGYFNRGVYLFSRSGRRRWQKRNMGRGKGGNGFKWRGSTACVAQKSRW